ncbi:DUF4097 family beta strand repeat-containing protein [Streptomyces atriruber]|uniref:DUF4097 family beta strand repeat-containing protein n=1 Tax=Streptomyces atriruber TaxID=545121 RepID=UPI0006E41EC8|nr:DUF4097 family beta strand repeat-containing protein [Streptomyces atriruber]
MTVRTRSPRAGRALAAVGGTVAVVLLVGACGADADDDTEPDHRTFALAGKTLTVESSDTSLDLVPAGSGAKGVKVTRWFDGQTVLGGDPKVTWEMDGDRLELDVSCSGIIANCSARHRVEVPRGVAVTVENKDGSVTAGGFRDAMKVRTKDGSVTVKDARAPLDLDSSDGSITVEGAEGPLGLHSSDGSITARGITSGRVSADSKDGSVRLELAAVPDRVEARSKDGSVDIAVPKEQHGKRVPYDVRTETSDSSVDVSVPRDDSSPHHVSVHSSDGKVTVRSAN